MSPTIQARAEAAAKEVSVDYEAFVEWKKTKEWPKTTGWRAWMCALRWERRLASSRDTALLSAAKQAEEWIANELDQQTKLIAAFGPDDSGEAHVKSMQAVLTALRAALTPDAAADGTKGEP